MMVCLILPTSKQADGQCTAEQLNRNKVELRREAIFQKLDRIEERVVEEKGLVRANHDQMVTNSMLIRACIDVCVVLSILGLAACSLLIFDLHPVIRLRRSQGGSTKEGAS
jgi:hypothetical protein